MNRYDKEINIIRDFQDIFNINIAFLPYSIKTLRVFNSIHSSKKWKKWVDSSSKEKLPPDFYNPKLKLMMDVMRVDDHSYINKKGKPVNPHNQRESELIKELISKNDSIKQIFDNGNLFIVPCTYLPTDEDHNYDYYVESFRRVVCNHISKIKKYNKNHPGYKTIFFLMDEASPYIRTTDKKKIRCVGDCIYAEPHKWWLDRNMISCFEGSNVDYLIWVTPYKHFESKENVELPEALIIDLNRFEYGNLISYNSDEMQSLEL